MSGVAMGTEIGPSYAWLFVGHLEQTLLQQYKKPVPEIYKRYIDDGIGATSLSYYQLLDFINFVQNFHPAVKFTYEISEKSVTFLDMKLYLKQGKLTTSVHYKSTDSNSYLDYRSSHNPSTKNSIPFSQFLRLRRLCSDDADFEEKAEEMANFFLQRQYPENTVKKALDQVRPISRQKTLKPNNKTASEERPIMSLLTTPRLSACAKSSRRSAVSCRHALRWPRSLADHH